ncbi:hypothetical protein G7Y79_00019g047560 [Physcia stellaris]|nr:hypothetical protein G7Y79_00019g047560 [Physcia stellaris]
MYLLSSLFLLPLTLSLPTLNPLVERDICITQTWNLQRFAAFTAGPSGADPGAPDPIFNYDHISFDFNDPNDGTRAQCRRSVGRGSGTLADGNSYPCGEGCDMDRIWWYRAVAELLSFVRRDAVRGRNSAQRADFLPGADQFGKGVKGTLSDFNRDDPAIDARFA